MATAPRAFCGQEARRPVKNDFGRAAADGGDRVPATQLAFCHVPHSVRQLGIFADECGDGLSRELCRPRAAMLELERPLLLTTPKAVLAWRQRFPCL